MEPPSWTEIPAKMTDWLADVNALRAVDTQAQPFEQGAALRRSENVRRLTGIAQPNRARESPTLLGDHLKTAWHGPDLTGSQNPDAQLVEVPARDVIERGSLRATRAKDGTWRSSRQWVDEYCGKRWARADRPRLTTAAATADETR